MTINQVSIFLENKYGQMNDVLTLLANANIRIIAATAADTSEFGIMRLIVNDPERAFTILKENNVSTNLTEILAILIDRTKPCAFRETINYFTQAGLNIEYIYTFLLNGKLALVLRTNNAEGAQEVVRRQNLEYLYKSDLANL
ncbi:MAG: acetolactate synthase [Prevotella sp.]|jgi:hypothetical protein|nr:acetolactate synthase [Prevotella sp.]